MEALTQASHKLAEQMYQQDGSGEQPQATPADEETPPPTDENVVDAEFEEVKDDDNK